MSTEHTDRAVPAGAAVGLPAGLRAGLAQGTITLAELVAYPVLVVAALVARLWDLGSRAMHHDESLHALYSYNLAVGDGFRHDPMMHGPFQMEATAGIFFLLGDSDFTARLLYALAGTVLVALPFFLRNRLGRTGALLVAAMLAASPAIFYFSRFARNDILMAVWTLGLVIAMWRFLDEGKTKYLFWASGLLALAFATKESAYVITTILGGYLLVEILSRSWSSITGLVRVGEANPLQALGQLVGGAWRTLQRGLRFEDPSRQAGLFVLLFTLSLPLGAALVSIVQDTPLLGGTSVVLASPIGSPPDRRALRRGNSDRCGDHWVPAVGVRDPRFQVELERVVEMRGDLRCRVGATLLDLLHQPAGAGERHMAVPWLLDRAAGRGQGQPAPLLLPRHSPPLRVPAARVRRRGRCLLLATPRPLRPVPRLLVRVHLPPLHLHHREDALAARQPRPAPDNPRGQVPRRCHRGNPVETCVEGRRCPGRPGRPPVRGGAVALGLLRTRGECRLLGPAGDGGGGRCASRASATGYTGRSGSRNFWSVAAASFALLLLALTMRASWHAVYRNGDTPVEMLVYTQTSPDLAAVYRQIVRNLDEDDGQTTISIDGTGGFSWPWAWYLRERQGVGYPSYVEPITEAPDASILLLNADNKPASDDVMAERYGSGVRIPHRWWFPETYRGLTLGKLAGAAIDRDSWRTVMDYFLFRELSTSLGSSDVVVYVSPDIPIEVPQRP